MLNKIKQPEPFRLYRNEILCPSGVKVRLRSEPKLMEGFGTFSFLFSFLETINDNTIRLIDVNNMLVSDVHYLRQVIDKQFNDHPVNSFFLPNGLHIKLKENKLINPSDIDIDDLTYYQKRLMIPYMIELINGRKMTLSDHNRITTREFDMIILFYIKLNWKDYETQDENIN